MRWVKTERGSYVNLDLAYRIYVQQIPVGPSGSGQFEWRVKASFPVAETSMDDKLEGIEITIHSFNNQEEAQKYIDVLMSAAQPN